MASQIHESFKSYLQIIKLNQFKPRISYFNQAVLLGRLWRHINIRRRGQFFLLMLMMIVASFAEILSIGAVLPFLGALTAPDRIFNYEPMKPFIAWAGLETPSDILLPLTVVFCVSAVLSGGTRLFLLWATTKLSFAVGADISIDIYRRTLYQPYPIHLSRNSSEIISGVSGKANGVIYSVVMPLLTLLAGSIMLVMILITLLLINPIVAITVFGGFGFIYAAIIAFTKQRLQKNSFQIADRSTQVIRVLQEGLGGIRDILIDGSQEFYCKTYREADLALRKAQASNQFIASSPRYSMEAIGIVLISVLAYFLAKNERQFSMVIPLLGGLALGAQRLLPVLQQIYNSWSTMRGGEGYLMDTVLLLDQPLTHIANASLIKPISFEQEIKFENVSFRYCESGQWIIRNINLIIKKGSRVGLIGVTGSGKSTFADILMGLLNPTEGFLSVDGIEILNKNSIAWRSRIAHVPQSIYLADATVAQNIAFGVEIENVDLEKVKNAARKAQISEVIELWPDGYGTIVGERGARLSGGQRQRIGIARAIYKSADVLIFDEATSALDSVTESSVMDAIDTLGNDLTILIIAHRLSTLTNCDKVIEVNKGGVAYVK